MEAIGAKATVADRLREQAEWCRRLGSPLYETVLLAAARDVETGGPCWTVLAGHEADDAGSALALRFLGAVHRLVLDGRAPALAAEYPSAGGIPSDALWSTFRDTVETHVEALKNMVNAPVQTNEVSRAAALLGGFLEVTHSAELPLHLCEIGASAGLNLRWDHYRYTFGVETWGPSDSPISFTGFLANGRLPSQPDVHVVSREGCDPRPIDPASHEGTLTLHAYVWPDMAERHRRLDAAIEVARRVPATVETAHADEWLARVLAERQQGVATVVFHSIVLQYLSAEERARVRATIEMEGARATRSNPLAWLRLEPGGEQAEVRLTYWPGGQEKLLATCSFHGGDVRWSMRG